MPVDLMHFTAPALFVVALACGGIIGTGSAVHQQNHMIRTASNASHMRRKSSKHDDSSSIPIARKRRDRLARRRTQHAQTSERQSLQFQNGLPVEIFRNFDVTLSPEYLAFGHAALDDVVANSHRLRSLKLEGAAGDIVTFLERLTSAPNLAELIIVVSRQEVWNTHWNMRKSTSDGVSDHTVPSIELKCSLPNLRRLTLDGTPMFAWGKLPATLERLSITGRPSNAAPLYGRMSRDSAIRLLSQLQHLPALQELELIDCLPSLFHVAVSRDISLSSLSHLVLSAPTSAASLLLARVELPPSTRVNLDLRGPAPGPTYSDGNDFSPVHITRIVDALRPILMADGDDALSSIKLQLSGHGNGDGTCAAALTAHGWRADQGSAFDLNLALSGSARGIHTQLVRLAPAFIAGPAVRFLSFSDTLHPTEPEDWSMMFSHAANVEFVHASNGAATAIIGALQDHALFPRLCSLALFEADFAQRIDAPDGFDKAVQRTSDVLTQVLAQRPTMRELLLRDCGVPSVLERRWQGMLRK